MAKRKPVRALVALSRDQAAQMAEGRARAYLEAHEEAVLHEGARSELHHLKAQAVVTLQRSMLNTGICPACGTLGLVVDRTAVFAALGVLDRTGFPPAKEIRVEQPRATLDERGLIERAVVALMTLDAEAFEQIVKRLLQERPELRPPIERALTEPALIEAGAQA